MPVMYELRCWGNKREGPVWYLVDGVAVTKDEYYRCWKENQTRKGTHDDHNRI